MNATFCLFPPSQCHLPSLARRNLLQMELLRWELWLSRARGLSWGCCGSCRKRRGSCCLLHPSGAPRALQQLEWLPEGPFPQIPGELGLPECGLKLGPKCGAGNLWGQKEFHAGVEGFGMAVLKHAKPFTMIAGVGKSELPWHQWDTESFEFSKCSTTQDLKKLPFRSIQITNLVDFLFLPAHKTANTYSP